MIDVISVNIDSNGKVKTSSKTLCNQYENGVAQFKLNVPPDWQDDSYFYYLCVVPPESAGIKQYAVPLTEEFIFLISSGITWHLGTWKFVFMVLNSELPETGVVPTEGIVSISDSWEGSVNKSILNLDDLAEQPVDPNFTLLYTDLMALRNSVEDIGEYAQAQGDYAKGVGEQLLQDKEDGVFDGTDGQDGADGQDGVSPTVTVATNTGAEYTLNITDVNGTITTPNLIGPQGAPGTDGSDGADGSDGFSPTIEVNTSTSSEYTLDITDASGTTTTPNLKGADGSDGQDGADGTSPTVTVNTNTDTIYKLDITDVNGTITTPNLKGADGSDGSDGSDGVSPTVAVNTSTSTTYTLDITDANGTITTPNLKGADGVNVTSVQSFYGTSSSNSTAPERWTLPDEYQEVEYIASDITNKPYIDSGVVCTDITKVECKFATLSEGTSQYITGARGQAIYIAITGSGSTTVYNATYNGTQVLSDITRANEVVVDSSVTLGEIDGNNKRTATFYCSDGTNTFTQTSSPISVIPSGATATLCMFGFHSTNNSPSRIYREKVYTDNGLVRDFIPCYIKATSEMGMYDLVTNQFYGTASNSRPFALKGSNVTYVPQLTDVEPYLWGYDLITYTDGTTQKSPYYIVAQKSSGGSGTTDYTDLTNKPQINSVTLTGNKSLSDLGIAAANGVINATDLTVSNNSVNLVNYVDSPGIYKVPSNCWIYTDSANSTANRIYGHAGDIVQIEPQIDAGDGEEFVEFDSYFTIYGILVYAGCMITADNTTWTSNVSQYERQSNKVTTISSSSRNTQYPSAKAVYDYAASKALYTDTTINTGRSANSTTGTYSTAVGVENIASQQSAFAEGEECTASGEASHAGGMGSVASGMEALAFGDYVTASGDVSVAIGEGILASSNNQVAIGKYNVEDNSDAYSEIVGNGEWVVGTGAVRSNARTTDWNGNGWYAGNIKVGGTGYTDSNAKDLATKDYIDSLVLDGATKTFLYNGKANNTAILTGTTETLSDSIYNYDLVVVGFNCLVGTTRVMELTMPIYPNSSIITWCDSTGTGATGAYHIVNANTAFATGNAYRVMWGFTDATHIRNIISNQVGWGSPGICYVIGYKFSSLPNGYATEQYVDNKITYGTSDLTAGTSPLTTGTLYFVYE